MHPFDDFTSDRLLAARRSEHLGPVDDRIALGVYEIGSARFREARFHDVGAMVRACEPAGNGLLRRTLPRSDVFADAAPPVALPCGAIADGASVLSDVREVVAGRHIAAVRKRCGGELLIP